jgi:hypothetical protein
MCACSSGGKTLTIIGELRTDRSFEDELVYLVPMSGNASANGQRIDSTWVKNGRFTFVLSVDSSSIRLIRPKNPLQTYFLQPLLVVIEPGTLTVRLDSVSYAEGAPLNEALQQWKDRKEQGLELFSQFRAQWRNTTDTAFRATLQEQWGEFKKADAAYNFAFVNENRDNALGRFVYEQTESLYTPEQKEALNMKTE